MSAGGLRSLLRNRPFLRYISGEAVSMTGTWMQVMAQGWVRLSSEHGHVVAKAAKGPVLD